MCCIPEQDDSAYGVSPVIMDPSKLHKADLNCIAQSTVHPACIATGGADYTVRIVFALALALLTSWFTFFMSDLSA